MEKKTQIIIRLQRLYSHNLTDEQLGIWLDVFKAVKDERFERAVSRFIETDRFAKFPIPGQIFACMESAAYGMP